MSFLAKLKIDGQEYNIIEFDLDFHQKTDSTGTPTEVARNKNLRLVIESDRKMDFFAWMISSTETKNGSIIFYRRDAMSRMRELQFTKAFCVDYKERFRSTTETPMILEIVLTSKSLDYSGIVYTTERTIF